MKNVLKVFYCPCDGCEDCELVAEQMAEND